MSNSNTTNVNSSPCIKKTPTFGRSRRHAALLQKPPYSCSRNAADSTESNNRDIGAEQNALAVTSGDAVGFSLGLIGGGGSILAVPLLLYVVGIGDAHVAIGTSALAVSLNAFGNLIGH